MGGKKIIYGCFDLSHEAGVVQVLSISFLKFLSFFFVSLYIYELEQHGIGMSIFLQNKKTKTFPAHAVVSSLSFMLQG